MEASITVPLTTENVTEIMVLFGRLQRKAAAEEAERKRLEDQVLRLTRGMAAAMRETKDTENPEAIYGHLRGALVEAFGTDLVEELETTLKKEDYA